MDVAALPDASPIRREKSNVDNQSDSTAQPTEPPSGSAVIAKVYQVHLEEFQFLWWQWKEAMKSPDYLAADVIQLETRLEAHIDGLLLPGPAAIPVLMEQLMVAEEPEAAFAAAWVLLSLDNQTATDQVMEMFLEANEVQMDGICQALCHVPQDRVNGRLEELFAESPPPIAVVAGEVLAFHQRLDRSANRISELIIDEDPWVRRHAWRVVASLGPGPARSET